LIGNSYRRHGFSQGRWLWLWRRSIAYLMAHSRNK
jgi:hypothetical protein